jgi:hypothetical protein
MFDSTTLPFLRAVVCFLEDRLSRLLPSRVEQLEFVVPEQKLPELERIAEKGLPTTWAAWIARSPEIVTILECHPVLFQVVKSLAFVREAAGQRSTHGGPFEAFAVLVDGLIRQPWLQSGRLTVGTWFRDSVSDVNGRIIYDDSGNTSVRCWLEGVEPYPARLIGHLVELVREMEAIGERKGNLLEELGIDPQRGINMKEIEEQFYRECENTPDEPRGDIRILASSADPVKTPASPKPIKPHHLAYMNAIKDKKDPGDATRIGNENKRGKKVSRKSYRDWLTRYEKKLEAMPCTENTEQFPPAKQLPSAA